MIELTWDQAILLYLSIMILSLFTLWSFTRKPKMKLITKKFSVCEFCRTPFIKGVTEKYSKCPACGNLSQDQ